MPADIIAFSTISTITTLLGGLYTAYKFGNGFQRKNCFKAIAKFILVKIFNEVKDNKKIQELAEELKEKFGKKTLKELKQFVCELVNIEKNNKGMNEDMFFIKNKDEILKNVENLKLYVEKRELVKDFCIFLFTRLYHTHIDIKYFIQLQEGLLEDAVINTKISKEELLELLSTIYNITNEDDEKNFENEIAVFEKEKLAMKEVIETAKVKLANNKIQRRLLDFFNENLDTMKLTTDMIKFQKNTTSASIGSKIGSDTQSVKSDSSNNSVSNTGSSLLDQINALKSQMNKAQ